MNVLIVDDIALNRKLLGAILDAEGHSVTEATDGAEALAMLECEQFDAVISDILMPRMDGYRLCYEVRVRERLRNLPFIFYTSTYTSASDEKLALDMGADVFLRKPAPASEIITSLQIATTAHRRSFTPVEPVQELNLMKEYNQQLVTKLEEKNTELTARNGELRTVNAQVQHLLEHSPAVVYQLRMEDQKIIPVVVSENIQRLLGVSVAECLNYQWWLGSLHPDDKERVLAEFSAGLNIGGCLMEYRIRHQDGSYRWVADKNRMVTSSAEETTEVVGVWTDVTDRRQAEDAARQHQEQLRLCVEHSPAAIAMLDRNMRYLIVSERWLSDYHLSGQNIIGRSHYEVFPNVPERWKEIHQRCLAGAVEKSEGDPYPHTDGAEDWIQWEIQPWRDRNGEIGGLVIFSEVLTDRKRAAQRIESQLHELQRWQDVTLHREDRVQSLKREVNEALQLAGKPFRYATALEKEGESP